MNLAFTYSAWWLVPGAIVAFGLSLLLYFRDDKLRELKKAIVRLMFSLRFLFIFMLVFLLLGPRLKFNKTENLKPVFVILQDNSSSVLLNKDSSYYLSDYQNDIRLLKDKLDAKFSVRTLMFGDSIRESETIDFSDKITKMSDLADAIELRFSRRELGGLLLASDGLYNQGRNPLYQMENLHVPVYTLALGDTIQQKDALISDVNYNQLAFLNNRFPLRIHYEAWDAGGEKLIIYIEHEGKEIFSKTIDATKALEKGSIDTEINADQLGLQVYKVGVKGLNNELSLENNTELVLINVIDNQQNILLLGRAPHPDLGAIKRALESNLNFSVNLQMADNYAFDVNETDLIVLHELPSAQFPMSDLFQNAAKQNVPLCFILGEQTDITAFNQLGMPMQMQLKGTGFDNAQAIQDNAFDLFDIPQNILDMLERIPPLKVHFGDLKFLDNHHVMLKQRISGINTDKPLIAFMNVNDRKIGYIAGTGLWKWRVMDFRINGNQSAFDELLNKSMQFLLTRSREEQFSVKVGQMFTNNENIEFQAELYNEAWELTNTPEVSISIEDTSGNALDFVMNRGVNAYRLNIGNLPAGQYKWTASCDFQSNTLTSEGVFVVRKIAIEGLKSQANHQLLAMISERTNGKMYFPEEIDNLSNTLLNHDISKSRSISEEKHTSLLNIKWIFFLLISWIGVEWFMRKFHGTY